MKRVGHVAAVVAVTLWGFWSAAPRVWCSAPGGHGAVESLFSTCCQDSSPACPPRGASGDHQGDEAPGDHPTPGSAAVPSGGAGCTDTLLPAALSQPDRDPILAPPFFGVVFGTGGGTPANAVPAVGAAFLRHLRDLSPPSCKGFLASLRI